MIRVRWAYKWVNGAVPTGPSTVAGVQRRSSKPSSDHPSGRQPTVDPLDEVAAVVVALRGRQPLGPLRAATCRRIAT